MLYRKLLCHNDTHSPKYTLSIAHCLFKKQFRINTILIIESGCGIIWIFVKNTVLYNQTQKACRIL